RRAYRSSTQPPVPPAEGQRYVRPQLGTRCRRVTMSKTDPSTLRSAITEELITYLGAGTINQERYAEAIDYAGLNIRNFDQLKKLHFVLVPDVIEYVRRIPEWIRHVKTVTQEQTETVRGEVRGAIDWRQ